MLERRLKCRKCHEFSELMIERSAETRSARRLDLPDLRLREPRDSPRADCLCCQ